MNSMIIIVMHVSDMILSADYSIITVAAEVRYIRKVQNFKKNFVKYENLC